MANKRGVGRRVEVHNVPSCAVYEVSSHGCKWQRALNTLVMYDCSLYRAPAAALSLLNSRAGRVHPSEHMSKCTISNCNVRNGRNLQIRCVVGRPCEYRCPDQVWTTPVVAWQPKLCFRCDVLTLILQYMTMLQYPNNCSF